MWVEAGTTQELARTRKKLVEAAERQIAVFWHDGRPHALANVCIHRQRQLVNGVILNGRIVCPGHQWAFDLDTGWCRERERCQPTHAVRVDGDVVYVDTEPATIPQPPREGSGAWPPTSS